MKFLLVAVNAKYIHSNPAVYSLRAFLPEEQRESAEIAEYTINQNDEDILADVYKRKPDVIGFSCYIWNIETVRKLLAELPKLLPGVPVWLGGPEVSYNAEELLTQFPGVTGVMIGEGESTFYELMEHYLQAKPVEALKEIAGLTLRSGKTADRAPTQMDDLPFLYYHPEQFENRIIYYESQRGCPFRCSYCLSSIEKTVRQKDLFAVKEELSVFLKNKVRQVKFIDRTFNCKEEHALEIWKFITENDNGVTNFHFEIAADCMTEAELALLKTMRPGLIQLEIGVQTINPDTIRAINRAMKLDRVADAVKRVHSYGNIHQHLDLIAGLPLENYESFARSFDWVYALAPEQLQLGFLKVLHGSQMERDVLKYGICYRDTPPYEVLYTNDISYEEICRLKKIEEMVELYYNSNQFVTTLHFLVKEFSSPFRMFELLAEFYERKGYFVNQPARAYRYYVLLEFIEEILSKQCPVERMEESKEKTDIGKQSTEVTEEIKAKKEKNVQQKNSTAGIGERQQFYRECLLYDLYLRENLRTRPDFATDPAEYRDAAREIYEREERERTLLPAHKAYDSKQMAKMTHLEPFTYRVWEEDGENCQNGTVKCSRDRFEQRCPNPSELCDIACGGETFFILFDYEQRDPLNANARTVEVVYENHG